MSAGDVLTADDLRRRRDLRARVAEMPPLIDLDFDGDDDLSLPELYFEPLED